MTSDPAEPVLVITHDKNQRGTGPSTSLAVSADLLLDRGVALTFAHTSRVRNFWKFLRAPRVLFDSVAALRHGYGAVWYFLALCLGKQRALYWHETEWAIDAACAWPRGFQPRRRLKTLAVRWSFRDAGLTHFHVCTHGANILRTRYRVRSPNIMILNNCCDSDTVLSYPVPNRHEPGLFVAVGRAQRRKGTDLFLEIASRVVAVRPEAKFLWVGALPDGEFSKQALTREIDRLGLSDHVTLTGFRSDRFAIMAEAEAILLTSRDDPLPKTLQEALALGRPSVAFDVGGVADIVHPYDDLVPFEHIDAFARILIDTQARRLDDAAQFARRDRFLQKFTASAFADRFMFVFAQWQLGRTA